MKDGVKNIYWVSGISLALVLFLLPIALGWWGIFIDDEAQANYPNQLFKARWVRRGILPYWNPGTYAGAHPFYTLQEGYLFYPVSWIFGLCGSLEPSFSSYRDLVISPLILHFLWAAAGGFLLGRRIIGISRVGAASLGLGLALSSSMITGVLMHPMTLSLAWFPWFLYAVAAYEQRPRPSRLVAGSFILALGGTVYPNYTAFGFIVTALIGLVLVLRRAILSDLRTASRRAAGLVSMGILSLVLAAPFWLSSLEALRHLSKTFVIDYTFLTGGPRSVPWRWFSTIFIPELFGSSNFAYGWGVVQDHTMYWCEGVLTRGMLIWYPVAAALFFCRKKFDGSIDESQDVGLKSIESGALRFWTFIGAILLLFSFLMMVGRFSPVYKMMYRLGPFFRIPYATRWHTVFSLGFAILAGIGVHHLWTSRAAQKRAEVKKLAVGYLLLVSAVAVGAVIIPPGYWRKLTDPGWFVRVPLLYWLLTGGLLLGVVLGGGKKSGRIVALLFFACLLRSAAWDLYRPMGITWAPEQEPAVGPEDRDLYRFMSFARDWQRDPLFRTGYSLIFADNAALVYDQLSFLGVGNKPMLPRMFSVLAETCEGMPNEVRLRDPTLPLVCNMSTSRWWFSEADPPAPDWEHIVTAPGGDLHLFRLPGALPRIFTLDRCRPAAASEQRHSLIRGDLRQTVLVEEEDFRRCHYFHNRSSPDISADTDRHFSLLQRENKIIHTDFSNPNSIQVDIEVGIPAMLVITDAWHQDWKANVDGLPTVIHRVNYLQRGLWLEKGFHRVKMTFIPGAVRTGRWFSAMGIILSLFILWFGRHFERKGGGLMGKISLGRDGKRQRKYAGSKSD